MLITYLDLTLQLTTSISIDTMELQFTFFPCVAISIRMTRFWIYSKYLNHYLPVFHIQALCLLVSGDHEASHLQEVFPPRLQSHTPLPHHRELC